MTSRDELYRLVWTEPMSKIAARFEVSGSYLARICTSLNVPRPGRGYWAKLAVGKAPPRLPLPAYQPGDAQHWSREDDAAVVAKPKAPLPGEQKKRVRINRDGVHGLLRDARYHFENGREVDENAYLRPYKKLLIDLTTSQSQLEASLALANDFFNTLEAVGYRVALASAEARLGRGQIEEREIAAKTRDYWQHTGLWSPYRPTVAYIGTVAIGLAIVEMSESVTLRYSNGKYVRESEYVPPRSRHAIDHSWTTTRDLPSGRMRIVAYSPYRQVKWSNQWQEAKAGSLRGQFKAILKEIEAMAPQLVEKLEEANRQEEIRHQQWKAAEDRRQREEDRKHVKQSIADSRSDLQLAIERWSEVVSTERL